MARNIIYSLGFDFPGAEAESIEFNSRRSLLDADIIVIEPSLALSTANLTPSVQVHGNPLITESYSYRLREYLAHWKSEVISAVKVGKTIFVLLDAPFEAYAFLKKDDFNASGEILSYNKKEISLLSSYDFLPFSMKMTEIIGTSTILAPEHDYLRAYWQQFGVTSPYQVVIDDSEVLIEASDVLIRTKHEARTVGFAVRSGKGAIVLIPPVDYDEDNFLEDDEANDEQVWNSEAIKFGKRWSIALVQVAERLRSEFDVTPPPDWTMNEALLLSAEVELRDEINEITAQVDSLQKREEEAESTLLESGKLRRLLYETGHPLEEAIQLALRTFGFSAENVRGDDSEFDVVFVSPEGRFLGEAEGKDRSAINIDKLSQLERNIQEDYAKETVSEYARGVLFGNAHRLAPVSSRPASFTDKCLSGADRSKIALVETPDLFEPARYLTENQDAVYAEECRKAFVNGAGKIVQFPRPPGRPQS